MCFVLVVWSKLSYYATLLNAIPGLMLCLLCYYATLLNVGLMCLVLVVWSGLCCVALLSPLRPDIQLTLISVRRSSHLMGLYVHLRRCWCSKHAMPPTADESERWGPRCHHLTSSLIGVYPRKWGHRCHHLPSSLIGVYPRKWGHRCHYPPSSLIGVYPRKWGHRCHYLCIQGSALLWCGSDQRCS